MVAKTNPYEAALIGSAMIKYPVISAIPRKIATQNWSE
jgi:hypothetical protein